MHSCKEIFETEKIDYCSGFGFNECQGNNPMILSVWYLDQDGQECFKDNWSEIEVKYCPFCGLKAGSEWINLLEKHIITDFGCNKPVNLFVEDSYVTLVPGKKYDTDGKEIK